MLFLVLLLYQSPNQTTLEPVILEEDPNGIMIFYTDDPCPNFQLNIEQDNNRRMKTIARALQESCGINLIIGTGADVIVSGDLVDISINELLTFVVRTNNLAVYRTGSIFELRARRAPDNSIKVTYNGETDLLTVDARDADPRALIRALTEQWRTIVPAPNFNAKVTGYVKDLPPMDALNALFAPYQLRAVDQGNFVALGTMDPNRPQQPTAVVEEAPPEEELPELQYVDDRFSGYLQSDSLDEAVRSLGRRAKRSMRILGVLEGGDVGFYLQNNTFNEVLNKLFLGTPYNYKFIDDIYLIGNKDNSVLTTSELVVVNHMNAQNVLAYLSGESGLFQTYALPARQNNLGSSTGAGFSRFNDRNRTLNPVQRSESPLQQRPSSGNPGQAADVESRKLQLTAEIEVDITLVRELNGLLVTATQDVIEEVKERIRMIDRPVPQVLIQALVVDYNTDTIDEYGVSINGGPFSYFPELDVTLEGNRQADGSWQIARLPSNFGVRLQALASQGKAQILSKPHIATLSGHEAYIEIGQTQYLLLSSETLVGNENPTSRTTQRIETVEANISLRVIPWVTASGEITTYIEPIFNTFLGQVQDNIPPPVSTRRLQSTIRLKNGETIILGGLIGEEVRSTESGVPGISRLPLLGYLFKNRDREFRKSELVIYLTPYVYYGDEGSVEIIKPREGLRYPLDINEQQIIKKKKTPWWKRKKKDKATPSPVEIKKADEAQPAPKETPPAEEENGDPSLDS